MIALLTVEAAGVAAGRQAPALSALSVEERMRRGAALHFVVDSAVYEQLDAREDDHTDHDDAPQCGARRVPMLRDSLARLVARLRDRGVLFVERAGRAELERRLRAEENRVWWADDPDVVETFDYEIAEEALHDFLAEEHARARLLLRAVVGAPVQHTAAPVVVLRPLRPLRAPTARRPRSRQRRRTARRIVARGAPSSDDGPPAPPPPRRDVAPRRRCAS